MAQYSEKYTSPPCDDQKATGLRSVGARWIDPMPRSPGLLPGPGEGGSLDGNGPDTGLVARAGGAERRSGGRLDCSATSGQVCAGLVPLVPGSR